jgi:hypothetical protein
MIILTETINRILGYHGSPYSDAGLAIKNGTYDGGANDDQVLFGYASFQDAINGRDIKRGRTGGYGRFITELSIPYDKMIIFDKNHKVDLLAWGLPQNLNSPDAVSIYCYHHSSRTKHIWGGVWDKCVVMFRKDVLPKIASREMDQFEEKWYPIGTLVKKYPDNTITAQSNKRTRATGLNGSKMADPSKMSYVDRVNYWQIKTGRNLSGTELFALKHNPSYKPS